MRYLAHGIVFLALLIGFSACSKKALALDEFLEPFQAVQGLAMGGALTADAQGYLAAYYNPAGLAKMPSRRYEILIADIQGVFAGTTFGRILSKQTFGTNLFINDLQTQPNSYSYQRYSAITGITFRGFSFTVLFNSRFAGLSDGTNIDVDQTVDIQPTIGFAKGFAGNLVKLGVTAKAILRDQLKGNYAHSDLSSVDAINAQKKSGLGYGFDAGMLLTLPHKWLPTLGVAYQNALDTRFINTSFLFDRPGGTPDNIPGQLNAAISLHPYFSRQTRMTFALEAKKIFKSEVPWLKRLHFGMELEYRRTFFFWGGLNQLYPTLGFGLRLPGGSLEVGTYAQDIGVGEERDSSRRFFLRYTISFEPRRR